MWNDDGEWTQPEGRDLLVRVRDIIQAHPERHDNRWWLSNAFETHFPFAKAEDIARWDHSPIPDEPRDPEKPVCGTKGCVAGWGAIESAPLGALLGNSDIVFPDGLTTGINNYAQDRMHLSREQAKYLFDQDRTTDEVLIALDALIEDSSALLGRVNPESYIYLITVTSEDGNEVYSTSVEVDNDDESLPDDYYLVDGALKSAWRAH